MHENKKTHFKSRKGFLRKEISRKEIIFEKAEKFFTKVVKSKCAAIRTCLFYFDLFIFYISLLMYVVMY